MIHFKHNPFLIIISSPSGAGKSTLCRKIIEQDHKIKLSISATTRQKRPAEIDGKDYFFISKKKFNSMVKNAEFIERACVFGNFYGTPKKMVEDELSDSNDVLFDIDWQGAEQLIKNYGKKNILTIFILPPSIEVLYQRLKSRAQDSEQIILQRMEMAKNEMVHCDNKYDYILINDDLKTTYNKIKIIIESFRIKRQGRKEIRYFRSKLIKNKWKI